MATQELNIPTISPDQGTLIIKSGYTARRQPAVMFHGSPGIGKSDMVRQAALLIQESLGHPMGVIDFRATLIEPVDLRGIPYPKDGKTTWLIPDFLPSEEKHGKYGILLIDELPSAPPSVQAALYQLVWDRALGDYVLPKGWMIVCAGNLSTDRGVVSEMPTPLRTRMQQYLIKPDHEAWFKWAVKKDIATEVIAFLRFRRELLSDFDPKKQASPVPRTWEMVSDAVNHYPQTLEMSVYSAIVGVGAATEFTGFLRTYRDLPSDDEILTNPKKAKVPNSPAGLFAVATLLGRLIGKKTSRACFEYMDRLATEYQIVACHDAQRRYPQIETDPEFARWAVRHADVLA